MWHGEVNLGNHPKPANDKPSLGTLNPTRGRYPPSNVSNVLNEEKRQQVIALGRLGWSLRRIERAAHIRRETIAAYLRGAGIPVRAPGGWGRTPPKPANEVITDSVWP